MKLNFSTYQIGSVFAFLSAFLFSTKAIFIKQAYALAPSLDATTLMVIRMASALPFFLILCWFGRHQYYSVKLKDWFLLILTGSLGYYISSWLDFFGLMFISASLERIILFLYPTLTVIASSIIFKQKLSSKVIIALILSYGGTVLVMLQEQKNLTDQHNLWLGSSLVFASAVAFACYLLLTPPLIKKFGSLNLTGLSLSIACCCIFIHYFLATPEPLTLLTELPHRILWYGIGLGIFATVLPTILLILSIEHLGASQSSIISSIGPVLTIFLAILFLDEHLNLLQWVGCILNIIGVMIITFSKNRLKI